MSLLNEITKYIVEKINEEKNPNRYTVLVNTSRPLVAQYNIDGVITGFKKTGPTVLKIEIQDLEGIGNDV